MPANQDFQQGWRRKRTYLPVSVFQGVSGDFASMGVGGQVAEVSTFELTGCEMAANDTLAHLMPIPWDMDNEKEVNFRVHYLSDSADADTSTFKLAIKLYAAAALTAATTSADKTITFDEGTAATTAFILETTNWAASTWATIYDSADIYLGLSVELEAFGGSADEMFVMGLEMEYTIDAMTEYQDVTS